MYAIIAVVIVVLILVVGVYMYMRNKEEAAAEEAAAEGYYEDYDVVEDGTEVVAEAKKRELSREEAFSDTGFEEVAMNFEDMAAKEALGAEYDGLQSDQNEWSGSITTTRPALPVLEVQNDVNTRIGLSRTNYRDIPNLQNQASIPSLYNDQLLGTDGYDYNIMGGSIWHKVRN